MEEELGLTETINFVLKNSSTCTGIALFNQETGRCLFCYDAAPLLLCRKALMIIHEYLKKMVSLQASTLNL